MWLVLNSERGQYRLIRVHIISSRNTAYVTVTVFTMLGLNVYQHNLNFPIRLWPNLNSPFRHPPSFDQEASDGSESPKAAWSRPDHLSRGSAHYLGGEISQRVRERELTSTDPPQKSSWPQASFFSGVYSWLVMTFNYLILWVRVMGQG